MGIYTVNDDLMKFLITEIHNMTQDSSVQTSNSPKIFINDLILNKYSSINLRILEFLKNFSY